MSESDGRPDPQALRSPWRQLGLVLTSLPMFVTGVGTAVPKQTYTQTDVWNAVQRSSLLPALGGRAAHIFEKVLCRDKSIAQRHLALGRLEDALERSPDALHARFFAHAPGLATEAAQRALAAAGCGPKEIDAVIIATCTGYLCPGLTSYVSERLGLRADALALDLVGQGCGAALPALRMAQGLIGSRTAARVLVACVEVSSAAFYIDDDPGVLLSTCLFGDGAGAALLAAEPSPGRRRIEWRAAGSRLDPAKRDSLRFEQREGVLRNLLTAEVPALAAQSTRAVLGEVLARARVRQPEIRQWLMHPGGRDVLAAVGEQLGLREQDLQRSAAVLRDYGNMSSASVLFVLASAAQDATTPSGYWWMSSFGAGFSCHGALLAVE